jgi:hypothetical protein
MNYATNRQMSDEYLTHVRVIVGPRLLVPSPMELDCKQATDLLVLRARDMRIAARVRRPGYFERYPFEVTVRASHPSGAKTELAKVLEGWGDWMLYGHADPVKRKTIAHWVLLDLDVFRDRWPYLGHKRQRNADGTEFVAVDVRGLLDGIVDTNHPRLDRSALTLGI